MRVERTLVGGARAVALLGVLAMGCGGSAGGGSGSASTSGGSTAGTPTPVPITAQVPIMSVGSFRALTYNVAGLPQGLSGSNPVANTSQISPLLNNYDLVLVQEDFIYHIDLQQHTIHPYQSLPLTQFNSFVNDGLNRFSSTAFTGFVRQRWNVCSGLWNQSNDCLSSKGFTVGRHELSPGVEVDVYNLHADAGGSSGDQNARTVQFAQLATFMDSYSVGRAVIIGGDTNLKTRIAEDARVLADFKGNQGLQDVGELLNQPDHIDRWFIRSSLDVEITPVLWRVADELVDSSGADLSDHPGINVDFDWRRLR